MFKRYKYNIKLNKYIALDKKRKNVTTVYGQYTTKYKV